MTRKSGVKGKTVRHLSRAQDAVTRQVLRAQRDPQAQIAVLDKRPGQARRERLRLGYVVLAADPEIVNKTPKRTRRRAKRQAQKSITIKGRAQA